VPTEHADEQQRWDDIESALGQISDTGHEWDDDPRRVGAPAASRRRPPLRLTRASPPANIWWFSRISAVLTRGRRPRQSGAFTG